MSTRIPFNKTYTSPHELVELLKSRGLSITDDSKVQHYLTHIGYYRLSAYLHPLLSIPKEHNIYKAGATFEQAMMLYRFDKKLRILLFNEIEKIEIAVRNAIVNVGCEITGDPFWMTNANNFLNPTKYSKTIHLIEEELKHTREDFIIHFKETYSNKFPPAWILAETLPFGVITNIYSNIKNKRIKKRISQSFELQVAPFESWLTIITVTRNSCCHHVRIWNRIFSIRATIPVRMSRPWLLQQTDPMKVYFDMCIIKYFLNIISPGNDMIEKMRTLFFEYPEVDLGALGFPSSDWEKEPLWSGNI
ncbi:MAG: Abi family protein [Prevotellaceae bacterium]|nr:Abi family protein [Prevotellaceae bacterium]